MKYIINKTIVFSPGKGLHLSTSDDVEFKLSLLSDRILFLLVTLNGTTVSKQEIHNYLWKEFSLDISTASINNNISYLRKFFKEMGVTDFIVTTPKVGVFIRQGSCIEEFPQESESQEKENDLALVVTTDVISESNNKKMILGWFLSSILLVLLFIFLLTQRDSDSINYVDSINSCKIFALVKLSAAESGFLMASAKTFVNEQKLECTGDKIIIASAQDNGLKYVRGNRDFFALCELHKNKLYSCDNYYYLGGVG